MLSLEPNGQRNLPGSGAEPYTLYHKLGQRRHGRLTRAGVATLYGWTKEAFDRTFWRTLPERREVIVLDLQADIRLPGEFVYQAQLPAVPLSVPWVRGRIRAELRSWRLPADAIETAELLLTELVTNAIKHGQPPTLPPTEDDQVGLTLRYLAGELTIEVSDSNPAPPVVAEPDEGSECWHGMNLVNVLSRKWGHYSIPGIPGKIVFCLIATHGEYGAAEGRSSR